MLYLISRGFLGDFEGYMSKEIQYCWEFILIGSKQILGAEASSVLTAQI